MKRKKYWKLKILKRNKYGDQLFSNSKYESPIKIEELKNIYICGFIELDSGKMLFYDDEFNKYWIDKYNNKAFMSNKNKFFIFDHINDNTNKKYIIYTYDIFKKSENLLNQIENKNYLYCLIKTGISYGSHSDRNYYNVYKYNAEENKN